jgi:hypothetical protein
MRFVNGNLSASAVQRECRTAARDTASCNQYLGHVGQSLRKLSGE